MEPALLVLAAWILFTGSHFLLSSGRLRGRLVARYGERNFIHLFSAVAAVTFSVLAAVGAAQHAQGVQGLALGAHPVVWPIAFGAIFLGFALVAGSLEAYARSPIMVGFSGPIGEPAGFERITRHGFFYGLALWALAHVLLVPTLSAAVFFGGFVVHALVGAALQDQKLRARLGEPYSRYLQATSAVPFAAILAGRQRLVLRELSWGAIAVGVAVAWLLREVHAHVFDFYGLWIVVVTLAGAGFATWRAERRAQQVHSRETAHG